MSWDKCEGCGSFVDTDDDPDAYVEVGNMRRQTKTICLCEKCREEAEEESAAQDYWEHNGEPRS